MTESTHLTAGTRASQMALTQTNKVIKSLMDRRPSLTVTLKHVTTKGDVDNTPIPLDTVGKAWFTKELEQELLDQKIDFAVDAVIYLAGHGHLPTSGTYGTEVFYAPEHLFSGGEQERHAAFYARWNGAKQHVLEHLNYVPRDPIAFMYALEDVGYLDSILAEAREHGQHFTEIEFEDLWNEGANLYPGVVLGISEEIEGDIVEHPEPADTDQRSVITPGGLPIRLITGIEPQNNSEFNRLVKLQEAIDRYQESRRRDR